PGATKYGKPCIIGCNLGCSGGRTGLHFSFSRFLYHVSWAVVEVTMFDKTIR
ncbi:hypothetical protein KSS87_009265, partial [Heliosperma pusillum]